jgi:hypothetical protein
MNSPFTDFTGMTGEDYGTCLEFAQEPGIDGPFLNPAGYSTGSQSEDESLGLNNNILMEGELTDSERVLAMPMNAAFMVSLGWAQVINEVIDKLKAITGIDAKDSYTRDINYAILAKAIDRYQEIKGLKLTNKGVMAIGTWSALQDDMGYIKYDKYKPINIDKAIKANLYYKNTLWGSHIDYIIKYFTALGLLKFPVDSKYFALAVAEWQRTDPKMKIISGSDDGILGRTSWDIMRTNIEHMFPGYEVKAHVKPINAAEAARRFVEIMKNLGDKIVSNLDTIDNQLAAYVAYEKLESSLGREAVYLGVNAIMDVVGSLPMFTVQAALVKFFVGLVKEHYDKKAENARRQANLNMTIGISDVILAAKNNATYIEDQTVVQHELEDQLKVLRLAYAKIGDVEKKVQAEFDNFLNLIVKLEETVRDDRKIFRMSLSQLVAIFSKHTRIIVNCQNSSKDMVDWDEADLKNVINDPGRKRLFLRFTSIHPNVNTNEDPITPSQRKVLNYIWKIWVNNGFAVKDLLVDREVYFAFNLFKNVGNFVQSYTVGFPYIIYINTIGKNQSVWTDAGDILGRVGSTLQFKNGHDIYTKGIDETNNTGRLTYRYIILTIVNSVMRNEYNAWTNSGSVGYSESETIENESMDEEIYGSYSNNEVDGSIVPQNLPVSSLAQTSTFLSNEKNDRATNYNLSQVSKSQLPLADILSALIKSVNIPAILKNMLDYNLSNPAKPYTLNTSGTSAVDSVFTEAVHQFQMANYLNPADHDAVIGQSTLESMGFVDHGLKHKLSGGGLYGYGQLNRSDIKPQVPALTNNEFSASNWYSYILKPSWLGVKITDGVHISLFRKLRQAEQWLLSQPQYRGMTPAALGKTLGFSADTRYSGARLSANKQAMHGFGLALDINVIGNPWIGAGWIQYDKALLQERYRMIKALRNASGNQSLPGDTIFEYLHNIAQSSGNDTRVAYGTLKQRNDEFIAYLRNNPSELSYWRNSQTFANRNPLNGFLNLHVDLVYALRQIAGLAWGAIDFGPRASGDIMHFDLRTNGVGKFLCEKIGGFVPKTGHPAIQKIIFEHEEFNDGYADESDYHEAIGEAEESNEYAADEMVEPEEEYNEEVFFESLVPAVNATDLRSRIDNYFIKAKSSYTLSDGTTVAVHTQFRLTDGDPIGSEKAKEKIRKTLVTKFGAKFYMGLAFIISNAAYGRAKPNQVAKITQALIDAGEFDSFKVKYTTFNNSQLIRRIQYEYGIGIDCGGYVQLSFINAFTGSDDDPARKRISLGLAASRMNENLYWLPSAHFSKIDFIDAKTGDMMVMNPRKNSDGSIHAVIIIDHSTKGDIHTFEVDSSWGHMYGDDASGIARRKFIYDAATKMWSDIDPGTGDETGKNSIGPYQEHPIKGVYRAKPVSVGATRITHEEEDEYEDWSGAIKLNQYYAQQLGWVNYYDQVNALLLSFSGQQNVSLSEEAFAQAVAEWQKQNGFSAAECDGIIGPNTWGKMKGLLPVASQPATPMNSQAPSIQNISAFNQWHAQKILDSINAGIVGANVHLRINPQTQLEKIVRVEQVINVNPNNEIIGILPVIYHICEQARQNNYNDIVIGSFIREPDGDKCTGHCAGHCIDLNYKGGSFESNGAVQMVINILNYLLIIPPEYKRNFGFGLPLQGNFFGHVNLKKFKGAPVSNIIDPQLRQVIQPPWYVFPDNDNHIHIQI